MWLSTTLALADRAFAESRDRVAEVEVDRRRAAEGRIGGPRGGRRRKVVESQTTSKRFADQTLLFTKPMKSAFRVGDHVSWSSEAGRVTGVIKKKLTAATKLKGYVVRASEEEPQYVIASDKTDHIAVHKGSALRKLKH